MNAGAATKNLTGLLVGILRDGHSEARAYET